jgi:hypothetical protein
MKSLWKRFHAALVMGLLWGGAGALGGGLIELIMNILPGSDLFLGVDIWPAVLAIPGFLGGVVFSLVLWAVEGRRRFDELTLSRFAVMGSIVGFVLGVVLGIPVIATFVGSAIAGLSAMGSLVLARRAEARERLGRGGEAPRIGHE